MYVFAGRAAGNAWPATITTPSTAATSVLTHTEGLLGYSVRAAGNVTGDFRHDLLVTVPRGSEDAGLDPSFLVAGDPATVLGTGVLAFNVVPLGDVNGDGFDDLGASAFESTQQFVLGQTTRNVYRVGHIFLGGQNGPDFDVPDLRLETTNRNLFASPDGSPLPDFQLNSAGDLDGDGRSEFALADNRGGQLHVFRGQAFETPLPAAMAESQPAVPFVYGLATPLSGTQVVQSDFNFHDANPDLSLVPALLGTSQFNHLGQLLGNLGDVNGDGFDDVFIGSPSFPARVVGEILLGPVRIDDQVPVSDVGSIVVDVPSNAAIAPDAGDVNNDGINDLIFVRPASSTAFTVFIVFGGSDLPSRIDDLAAIADRTITVPVNFVFSMPVPRLLDWNGDGFDDILIQTPASETLSLEVAVIYSGRAIKDSATTIVNESAARLLSILPDTAVTANEMALLFGPNWQSLGINPGTATKRGGTPAVVGDVNGDGLDDLVFLNRNFITVFGNTILSRGYLLLGRATPPAGGQVSLAAANTIFQDYSLSTVSALGDIDGDGLDDIAFGHDAEDSFIGFDGLSIIRGSAAPPAFNGVRLNSQLVADRTIHRFAADELGDGMGVIGTLTATAGDFDGDGRIDLAVGEPNRIVTGGIAGTPDLRGHLYVYFAIGQQPTQLLLADADLTLDGEAQADALGTFLPAPRVDLDADGIDDLLAIAANATTFVDEAFVPNGGKAYILYGSREAGHLPAPGDVTALANFGVSGSGSFLVDRATGQPETFNLQLEAGQAERWFRFTTLGDGQPGDHALLSPEFHSAAPAPLFAIGTGTLTAGAPSPTAGPTDPITLQANSKIGILEFDIAQLLGDLDNPAAISAIQLQLQLNSVVRSAGDSLRVSLINREGDGWLNAVDATATATATLLGTFGLQSLTVPGLLTMDVRSAVLAALAAGHTRITLRLDIQSPGAPGSLVIEGAGALRPQLLIERPQAGVLADLRDENGALLAAGRSLFDLQLLQAGTFYLRVYNPQGPQPSALPFTAAIVAPGAGDSHPVFDRDILHGSDGDDQLVGNAELDRLFGEGGHDSFTAEIVEVRDAEVGETVNTNLPIGQRLADSRFTPLNPEVNVPDAQLRAALSEVLGRPITQSHPLTASELASLQILDLNGRDVVDLTGLEHATNLHRLYLGWNHITDLSPLTVGLSGTAGPANLEVLTLDGNAISDLGPLATLAKLKSLSLDFNPITDVSPLVRFRSWSF